MFRTVGYAEIQRERTNANVRIRGLVKTAKKRLQKCVTEHIASMAPV